MQILSTNNEYIYTKPFKEGYIVTVESFPLQQDIYRKNLYFTVSLYFAVIDKVN